MKRLSGASLPLLPLLIGVLSLALLLALLFPGKGWQAPQPVAPSIPEVDPLSRPTALHDGNGQLMERPPFWASRRPTAAETAAAETEEEEVADIDGAVMIGKLSVGGKPVVILLKDDKTTRVRLDGEVNGWTLTQVEDDTAVFHNAGGRPLKLSIKRPRVKDLPNESFPAPTPAPPPMRVRNVAQPPQQQQRRQAAPPQTAAGNQAQQQQQQQQQQSQQQQ